MSTIFHLRGKYSMNTYRMNINVFYAKAMTYYELNISNQIVLFKPNYFDKVFPMQFLISKKKYLISNNNEMKTKSKY